MDTIISNKEKQKANFLQGLKWLAGIGLLGLGFIFFREQLKTSATKKEFHIVQVEKGPIENSISASGLVVPAFEQQINTPINTEIKSLKLQAGAKVQKGDVILELDREYIQLEFESLNDQLELRKNNIVRLKHEYDKNLKDLDFDDQIKALQLSSMQANLADVQHLKTIGGATQEEVEQVELNIEIARLEKKKLENELSFRKSVIESDRRNLELEVLMQEKKLQELSRKLKETNVRAPRAGVLTWVNVNIGRKVNEGEALARIANLDSYRVEGTCSDRYASKIFQGMPVKVTVGKTMLNGTIASILPAVENNTIEFIIDLEEKNADALRPNMKVEVALIEDNKADVLRLKNGATFSGGIEQDVFVVRGEKAVKTTIRIGITNSKFIEIVGGDIKEGDQVIISDMEAYQHLDEINLSKN